jgi:hypothetical protein
MMSFGAVLAMVLALGVVMLSRSLRSHIAGDKSPASSGKRTAGRRDWAVTPLPTGLARTLTQKGLVNAEQLANMSPAEREFFVATVAARVGEAGKPRLMDGTGGSKAGEAVVPTASSVRTTGAPPTDVSTTATAAFISSGSLISAVIHCPVCRSPLGQRSATPLLMARCPGCTRRVAARVDGERLVVTVDYGAGRVSGETKNV